VARWDLYEQKLRIDGNTLRDRQINLSKKAIEDSFLSSPSYKQGTINDNDTLVDVWLVNDISSKNIDDSSKSLIMIDGSLNVGDIFNCENIKWIVTKVEPYEEIYIKARVDKINNILKFYKNHILFQVPCIVNKGDMNMDEAKFISIAADEYIMVCPNNSDSLNIDLNTRFILTGSAYKVLGIDNISNVGLLNIRIKEDVVIEDDNLTLGIANYYSSQIIIDTSTEDITISPLSTTLRVGKSVTYAARFTDGGIENNLIHFNWEITNVDRSDDIYAEAMPNHSNNTCVITAKNSYSAIGKIINIKISLVENPTRFIVKQFNITSLV